MTNTKLYTAVGKFQMKGSIHGMRCPLVTIGSREFILDMQEMILWTILNWRILTEDEIAVLYEKKSQETGFLAHRSAEECMHRLIQLGLIAEGAGDTGADALYDLLSELCVIPISENLFLRAVSFIQLTFLSRLPYSVTKKIFRRDKRNSLSFISDEDLLDILYHDDYITSDNIAYTVRSLPRSRSASFGKSELWMMRATKLRCFFPNSPRLGLGTATVFTSGRPSVFLSAAIILTRPCPQTAFSDMNCSAIPNRIDRMSL